MFRFWQSVLSSLLKLPLVAAVGILVTPSAVSAPIAFAQALSTLHDFGAGRDGANPFGGLTADAAGILYGATVYGGTAGRGTVFELTQPATSGGSWTETVLYSFQGGADGDEPFTRLTPDKNGNLYGVTALGGNQDSICSGGCGTVFETLSARRSGR